MIYVLLVLISAVYVSNHGGAFSYILFYSVILYVPLSLLYIIYTILVLHIYQETEDKLIHKNTSEKYQLVIENVWFLPIGGITLYYDDNISQFKHDFTVETFNLLPREKLEINTEITCKFAGSYDAGITAFSVQDIFGLIRIKRDMKIPVRVHVLPIITDIAHKDIMSLGDMRKNGNLFPLNQQENYLGNDIRKYEKGDSLNTVHWKNYARTGEMYVRLPEHQESEIISMLLITEVMEGKFEQLVQRDRFLEYLVSIGEYFGMRRKPLIIYYYNISLHSFIIDSPESFNSFYGEVLNRIESKASSEEEEKLLAEVSKKHGNILVFRERDCLIDKSIM